jgi:hypothetical protein
LLFSLAVTTVIIAVPQVAADDYTVTVTMLQLSKFCE